MSRAASPSAGDVYDEHGDTVDDLAERDDEIGAIFRALKTAAGEDDE
ncbi:hypothetical protein [Halococcus saccharolyticus]|nr:hypothetical protein [Halococcus saccharolyticus]